MGRFGEISELPSGPAMGSQTANSTDSTHSTSFDNSSYQTNVQQDFGQSEQFFGQYQGGSSQPNAQQALYNPKPMNTQPTAYGDQFASDDTSRYSAFTSAYAEDINACGGKWTTTDNPFSVYHKEGGANFMLMRKAVTKKLLAHIKSAVGGLDAVYSFTVQNGVIIINNAPITPIIPDDVLVTAPFGLRGELARGAFYNVFDFKTLLSMPNIATIKIDKRTDYFDTFFWSDLRVDFEDIECVMHKLTKLKHLLVETADYVDIFITNGNEASQSQTQQETFADMDRKDRGRSFAGGLAALLGIKSSVCDEHPILQGIGNSAFVRACRHTGMFAGALGLVNLGLAIANPFLVITSLFSVGAYVAHCRSDKIKNNGGYSTKARTARTSGSYTNSWTNSQRSSTKKTAGKKSSYTRRK